MRYPSQGGKSAAAPEGVGDNPEKAHDDQARVGYGEEDEAGGDGRVVEVENDARYALRAMRAGAGAAVAVVAVVAVAIAVGDDEVTVVVAVVVAELAVVAVAYA